MSLYSVAANIPKQFMTWPKRDQVIASYNCYMLIFIWIKGFHSHGNKCFHLRSTHYSFDQHVSVSLVLALRGVQFFVRSKNIFLVSKWRSKTWGKTYKERIVRKIFVCILNFRLKEITVSLKFRANRWFKLL